MIPHVCPLFESDVPGTRYLTEVAGPHDFAGVSGTLGNKLVQLILTGTVGNSHAVCHLVCMNWLILADHAMITDVTHVRRSTMVSYDTMIWMHVHPDLVARHVG